MGLLKYLNSDYVRAANRLKGGRRRIVAYVESYDDVAFWSQILRNFEDEEVYFEVMLPSRNSLAKGKKMVLSNQLGPEMIACVDADYDWILSHIAPMYACREFVKRSPYVIHTYAYAIENMQCYAECMDEICVKATLNDSKIFSFTDFLRKYSETIWPLFLWSIWVYSTNNYRSFSLSDFAFCVTSEHINFYAADKFLNTVRERVSKTSERLTAQFPEAKKSQEKLACILSKIGVTRQNAYLFMRGHDLMDRVVVPVMESVCRQLRKQRENEIVELAQHSKQERNELSAYRNACGNMLDILRKHNAYTSSDIYKRIIADTEKVVRESSRLESRL